MKKKVIAIGIVCLFLFTGLVTASATKIESNKSDLNKYENIALLSPSVDYIPHEAIIIHGNDEFTTESGVTGGSGTQNDPYIIEGWEVCLIMIYDTTAYFVIRNCCVYGDRTGKFINVTNGVIQYTIFESNELWGPSFKGSCSNVLEYCTINNCTWGLMIDGGSNNNEIHHCSITGKAAHWGICLTDSEDNNIHHNNIYDLEGGASYVSVIHHRMKSEGLLKNQWDSNYWGNYRGLRFKIFADLDGDGFGNFPYPIVSIYNNNFFPRYYEWDRHPAMQPYQL